MAPSGYHSSLALVAAAAGVAGGKTNGTTVVAETLDYPLLALATGVACCWQILWSPGWLHRFLLGLLPLWAGGNRC